MDKIRILFFGDVIGKAGRAGLNHQLPLWREEFAPDFVVANIENIAHGFGMGRAQIEEIADLGIDVMTGGNHILKGKDAFKILEDEDLPVVCPLNVGREWPGKRFITKKAGIAGGNKEVPITVISLLGQHGMAGSYNSPYEAVEDLIVREGIKENIIIIDWHAEASSEKVALGWLLDGKVSAVLGTHTHVPTADERILPEGTALISDAGMVGPHNSVIGHKVDTAIKRIARQLPVKAEIEEYGPVEINAVLIDIDVDTKKAVDIKRLREVIEVR